MNIFPGNNEKVITSIIIAFLLGAGIILISNIEEDTSKIILSTIATLAAAFFGAYYAFSLQNQKQLEERNHLQVEAGNKAIFNLINTYNKFCNFRDQFINEHRNSSIRYVAILPAVGMTTFKEIDFDSLAFLFKSEERNILAELSMFQTEVQSTLAIIKERSDLHVNTVQPKLEDAASGPNKEIVLEEIRDILGERTYVTLIQGTDQMIEFTDIVIEDSERLIEKLRNILKDIFQDHVIVGMEKLDQ